MTFVLTFIGFRSLLFTLFQSIHASCDLIQVCYFISLTLFTHTYLYPYAHTFTTRNVAFCQGSMTGASTPGKNTRGHAKRCSWQSAKAEGGKYMTHARGLPLINCKYSWHPFRREFEIQNWGTSCRLTCILPGVFHGVRPLRNESLHGVRNLCMRRQLPAIKLTCEGQAPGKLHKALACFLTHRRPFLHR